MSARSTMCAKIPEVDGLSQPESGGDFGDQPGRHSGSRGQAKRLAKTFTVSAVIVIFDTSALLGALALTGYMTAFALAYAGSVLILLSLMGLHRPRLNFRLADDLRIIMQALVLPFVVIAVIPVPRQILEGVTGVAAIAIFLITGARSGAYVAIRGLRSRGVLAERALIIGTGGVGTGIATVLREHPEYGLIPAGFVDTDPVSDTAASPVFALSSLPGVVRELEVTHIVVAFSRLSDAHLVGIVRDCAGLPVDIHVVPRLFELGVATSGTAVDDVWGFHLARARRPAHRRIPRTTKRIFDLVVGSILLLLSGPVFVAAALAVRLSSPGPVFFRQERLGENGRSIQIVKFRTMLCNNDSDETWCVSGDTRRTCVGLFLRKTGLDELPQLVNVLLGTMSLIGPRPERPYFVRIFSAQIPRYTARHRVPQGITGWAQVHNLRGDTSIADRIRFDNYYVENWSVWMDVWILIRTVGSVLGKRGA